MWKKLLLLAALGTIAAALPGSPASAQATRTWVSGVGDDANPCSRTAPCKTFAGAISKTAAGGEIDVLDPGGFGALTITKSITIDGGGGVVASALVAGTNGFVVAAGATDVVILRNLRFQGLLGNGGNPGGAGLDAIKFISGAELIVDNCDVYGFNSNGIEVALSTSGFVHVRNSTFRNNAGNGISATATSGVAIVQATNISIVGTNNGGTNLQTGINVANGGIVAVSGSTLQNLATGLKVTGTGKLDLDNSVVFDTGTAVSSVSGTTVNLNNNSLYNNTAAFSVAGTAVSAGNNKVVGSVGTITTTPMTQQ